METHGIAQVDGVTIPAPLKVSRQVKLEQITGGTIKDLDEHSHHIGNAKPRKLRALADAAHAADRHLLQVPGGDSADQKRPPTGRGRVEALTGAVTGDERTQLINDFQANQD